MRRYFWQKLRIYVQNAEGYFCSFFVCAVRSFFWAETKKRVRKNGVFFLEKVRKNGVKIGLKKVRKNGVKFGPKRSAKTVLLFCPPSCHSQKTTPLLVIEAR